jgi:hypothetical protein
MREVVRNLVELRLKSTAIALAGASAIWVIERVFSEHYPFFLAYLVMETLGLIASIVGGWRWNWIALGILASYTLVTLLWMASVFWVSTRAHS